MKILFLTPWYPDEQRVNHGVFIRDQAVAIARHHQVVVVAAKIDYSRFGFFSYKVFMEEHEGVQEHRLVVKRSIPIYNQFNYLFITLIYSLRIARVFKPDILHGNISYPGAVFAWLLAGVIKKPFVVTEHFGKVSANFRSSLHRFLSIKALRKAKKVICVSKSMMDEMSQYVEHPTIVPNVINFQKFQLSDPREDPYSSGFHFGILGGLENDTKGLDVLLQAASKLKEKFTLHVGGSGSMLEAYKKMADELGIAHCCKFYGLVKNWEVPAFMHRIHFFVSASRFESFGMVIVEAMACGLPVVTTNSGGPRDYVNDMNGVMVAPASVESMREGLETMMRQYRSFDSKKIRAFAEARFSERVFLEKMDVLYQDVATSQGTE